jgi:hypothetical protein
MAITTSCLVIKGDLHVREFERVRDEDGFCRSSYAACIFLAFPILSISHLIN